MGICADERMCIICVHVHIRVWCMCVHMSVYMHVYISMCEHMGYICICMHEDVHNVAYMHVYTRLCIEVVCICVCHVHMSTYMWSIWHVCTLYMYMHGLF